MSVAAKLMIVLTVITLLLSLGAVDTAGFEGPVPVTVLLGQLWERLRLEPREVYRVVPVLATDTAPTRQPEAIAAPPSVTAVPCPPVPATASALPTPKPPPADQSANRPVRGLYVTAWKAGNSQFIAKLTAMMRENGLNSLVIDIKDDTGVVSYSSRVPLAVQIGAGAQRFQPERLLERLQRDRIYSIARIVVFKDPLLATQRKDLAVLSSRGGLWRDRKGICWVDPYNKTVWEYNVALALEAAGLGFKEIQFDYVRFTSDGALQECRYPGADDRTKGEVIRDFLAYAAGELRGLGVKVSADVFGLTCSVEGEMGIGQIFEDVAAQVDIISPMVYPSHYAKGTYQLANPDIKPYETVYRSLRDARRKLEKYGRQTVTVRPWLQDFSLPSLYNRAQLEAQVKAVYDAGLTEWLFWNPHNNYKAEKYRFNRE
jgi:hypothetical protein